MDFDDNGIVGLRSCGRRGRRGGGDDGGAGMGTGAVSGTSRYWADHEALGSGVPFPERREEVDVVDYKSWGGIGAAYDETNCD